MRSFGGRVLIGLGLLAAAVMTVGYAFIFSDIAEPPGGDRGVLALPRAGEVRAARLDDGTPVYVVNVDGFVGVIDARGGRAPGKLAGMVAWCRDTRSFIDFAGAAAYQLDGTVFDGPTAGGLSILASRPSDDGQRLIIGSDADYADASSDQRPRLDCPAQSRVMHEPEPGEIFDPSVAADQEPPGWIWLEGSLVALDDSVRLCDGTGSACETWAEVRGIDPASLEGQSGQFIGRVRDGALEGLMFVPDIGDPS